MQLMTTRRPKLAGWFRSSLTRTCLALGAMMVASIGGVSAQDFDFGIRTDKASYAPGEALTATAGMTTRAPGAQGWSYGVQHDPAVLTLNELRFDTTDAMGVMSGGLAINTIIESDGSNIGFVSAVVLSLTGAPVSVPTDSEFFSILFADYTVSADACPAGATEDVTTAIEYTDQLAVPGSPPADINVTVGGAAVPVNLIQGEAVIQCAPVVGGLTISFNDDNNDLNANGADTLDVNVLLSSDGGSTDVQGWSYGVALDPAALTATAGAPGADAAALNGGNGPDFVAYDLADMSSDGSAMGVTVGVVISTAAPATEVLSIADGATAHLDTITVRSTEVLTEDTTTSLAFNETMGDFEDRDPIEVIAVVGGNEVKPDLTSTKTINLIGGQPVSPFIRADANNDARVDIADGIWIIGMLFYGTEMTACTPAADANDDDSVDISDAMYIFQWRLQPGATPGNLFPAPPGPFPECGTSPDATPENCPIGSHVCSN